MTNQEFLDVVIRTAQYAFDEIDADSSNFHKWLSIWSMRLVEEIQEFINEVDKFYDRNSNHDPKKELEEAGDILWYLFANAALLGFDVSNFIKNEGESRYLSLETHGLKYAIERMGVVKKIIRDSRTPDFQLLNRYLPEIFSILSEQTNIEKAMEANKQKLLKRYPNGYSSKASINRVV